jgi:hypothetical protein
VVKDHDRITSLEKRVEALEKSRSGRRGKPIVVTERGVCGIDPDRDSATCPDASLYRRNQGCMGTACRAKASKYYAERRIARTP